MTPTPDAPRRHTRNPRGEGDRLRQDLIAAANRLLENGATHQSLSLRAVAREVGIAATSIYLHFPDKMALLLAVYQHHFADLTRRVDQAIAQHTDPGDRLRAAALAYHRFAEEHPDAYKVMFTTPSVSDLPRQIPGDQRPGTAVIQSVHTVMSDCIDAGLIHPVDPFAATMCLWAALHGMITLRADRPYAPWPPPDQLIDTLLAIYLTPR